MREARERGGNKQLEMWTDSEGERRAGRGREAAGSVLRAPLLGPLDEGDCKVPGRMRRNRGSSWQMAYGEKIPDCHIVMSTSLRKGDY